MIIEVDRQGWWQQLGERGLPAPLVDVLRALVGCTLTPAITPEATDRSVQLIQRHAAEGIRIGGDFYAICAIMPPNRQTHVARFKLVPSHPGCTVVQVGG